MAIFARSLRFLNGFLMSYGPERAKRRMWNKEYRSTKWHFADHTAGDCVYAPLEDYANHGSILDLGCGSGNTGNELSETSYESYLGVDISDEALAKARSRSEACGRDRKNRFVRSDFFAFDTTEKFDTILLRESIYHIPIERIRPLLDKYSRHLKEGGVFIVRLRTLHDGKPKYRPSKMLRAIEKTYPVIEKREDKASGAVVIVFHPRSMGAQ